DKTPPKPGGKAPMSGSTRRCAGGWTASASRTAEGCSWHDVEDRAVHPADPSARDHVLVLALVRRFALALPGVHRAGRVVHPDGSASILQPVHRPLAAA